MHLIIPWEYFFVHLELCITLHSKMNKNCNDASGKCKSCSMISYIEKDSARVNVLHLNLISHSITFRTYFKTTSNHLEDSSYAILTSMDFFGSYNLRLSCISHTWILNSPEIARMMISMKYYFGFFYLIESWQRSFIQHILEFPIIEMYYIE